MKPATELIHHSDGANRDAAPLTTPIYETTTFLFQDAAEVKAYNEGRSSKYLYSRYANPTVTPVEQKIAALEGAEAALVLSSGQAATTTALMGLTSSGDEVVCSSAVYGGTLHLLADLLSKFGIKTRFVTLEGLGRPETILSDQTKLVWFESPINPTLRCVDVAAVARACKARGVISVVDNTFASPINQQPIALGVDLVMHSATKYLNGHSDVTAGALAGPARLMDPILDARKKLGTVLDPYAAYALGRGSRRCRCGWSVTTPTRWQSPAGSRKTAESRLSTIPGSSSIPIMRLPRSRCAALAGWSAWTSAAVTIVPPASLIDSTSSGALPASAASRACAACRC